MIALFFDTETTGLKQKDQPELKPAIVQLGAILQDIDTTRVLHEVNIIVKLDEGVTNHPKAYETHHISEEMTHKFGVDSKLADVTFAFLVGKADVIVAHNISFDLDMVEDNLPHSWKRIQDKIHFCTKEENIDVVKAEWDDSRPRPSYYTSKGYKPARQYKWPSLMETYEYYFDKKFEGAHDAMADIRACRDIFFAMSDKDSIIAAKAAEMAQKEAEKPLELAL